MSTLLTQLGRGEMAGTLDGLGAAIVQNDEVRDIMSTLLTQLGRGEMAGTLDALGGAGGGVGTPVEEETETVDADIGTIPLLTMEERRQIAHDSLPVAVRIAEDITYPLHALRIWLKKLGFQDDELTCPRARLLRIWLMANSPVLAEVPRFTVAKLDMERDVMPDPVASRFLCPITHSISMRWWITNGGDPISDEAITGILNASSADRLSSLKHPLTRGTITSVVFNNEKACIMRDWASSHCPDLLEHGGIPLMEGKCVVELDMGQNRHAGLSLFDRVCERNGAIASASNPVTTIPHEGDRAEGTAEDAGGGGAAAEDTIASVTSDSGSDVAHEESVD